MNNPRKEFGFDSSTLKWLVLVSLIIVTIASFLIRHLIRGISSSKTNSSSGELISTSSETKRGRARGLLRLRNVNNADSISNVTSQEQNDEDLDHSDDENGIPHLSKKIGTKKLKKLELKAEKKVMREQEIRERDERKRKETSEFERRIEEEIKRKEIEKKIELEEKRSLEEILRKERLEYEENVRTFEVQEEGYDESADLQNNENLLHEFIVYCHDKKIVILEDAAARFKLKVPDVIDRLKSLVKNETIDGIFDDRGKFICLTSQDLKQVAKFIEERGRVSIYEIAQHSNELLNLDQKRIDLPLNICI